MKFQALILKFPDIVRQLPLKFLRGREYPGWFFRYSSASPMVWYLTSTIFIFLALVIFRPGYSPVRIEVIFPKESKWILAVDTGDGFNRKQVFELSSNGAPGVNELTVFGKPLLALRIYSQYNFRGVQKTPEVKLSLPDGFSKTFTPSRISSVAFELSDIRFENSYRPAVLLFTQFATSLFLAAFFLAVIFFIRLPSGRRIEIIFGEKRIAVIWGFLFGISLVIFGSWLFGQWPGYYSPDSTCAYDNLRKYLLGDWFGYICDLYVGVIHQIWDHPAAVTVAQVIYASFLSASAVCVAIRKGAPVVLCVCVFFLFVLLPSNGVMTVYLNREIPFAWLYLALTLYFPAFYIGKKDRCAPSKFHLYLFALIVCVTSLFRREAIVLFVSVPVVLILTRLWTRRSLLVFLAFLAGNYLVLHKAIPYFLVRGNSNNAKVISAIVNPLGYILNENYFTDDHEEDRKIIERVLDYDRLIAEHNPYDITIFYRGGIRWGHTEEEFRRFRNRFLKIVLNNFDIFLANRVRMFAATIGVSRFTGLQASSFLNSLDAGDVKRLKLYNLKRRPVFRWLQRFQDEKLDFANQGLHSSWVRYIVWNNWLPLLLALTLLFLYPFCPLSASAAFIMLFRVPAVFMGTPAAQFKYLYDIYLFSFFIIPFAVIEIRRSPKLRSFLKDGLYDKN